jgi:hypothetical protein
MSHSEREGETCGEWRVVSPPYLKLFYVAALHTKYETTFTVYKATNPAAQNITFLIGHVRLL